VYAQGMFKISDFSRFSRVSIKMLRHYDEMGLLKPAVVDPATNYRYYTADQLPRLNRILALKDLGFTLEQIHHLLDDSLSAEAIRGMLKLRRAEIEQQLQREYLKLAQVEARLRQIEAENCPSKYDVVVRQVEPQLYATLRKTINEAAFPVLFETLESYAAVFKARAAIPPMTIYYDTEYPEQEMDVEVAVPVTGIIPGSGEIMVREIAGAAMACVVHPGSYAALDDAVSALMTWIDSNGYHVAGEMREVYLRFGADKKLGLPAAYLTDHDALFVTELQIPVRKFS
ncbi:MAG: MerR family transcriptional regulator, partial [Anaerolineae bacterium]|nr:MerR family transcriptional regulator [Anaerolineae bacterium]